MTRTGELRSLADQVVTILSPACTRIEIVGALRRSAPTSNDIDIVCQPKLTPVTNLFGEVIHQLFSTEFNDQRARAERLFDLTKIKGDQRLFTYVVPELDASIDLFVCLPPAQYGALQAIRTGPADFAKLCVTSRLQGGAMPPEMRQQDGALWRSGALVETPDEENWFAALGLPCWPPARRSAEGLRMYLDREVVRR